MLEQPPVLSKGEVIDGLYKLVAALNAIPPRPKEKEISFADSERGRAILACLTIAKFLQNYMSRHTETGEIFNRLAAALLDLEDGIVDPMLEKAKINGRPLDPSNLWILRALVARYIVALRAMGEENASSILSSQLENAEVLVSASEGKSTASSIISSFEKWTQAFKSKKAGELVQFKFDQWRAADEAVIANLDASDRKRWLDTLVNVIQAQIDERRPAKNPLPISTFRKPRPVKKKSKRSSSNRK
jgi:hypothetical protein